MTTTPTTTATHEGVIHIRVTFDQLDTLKRTAKANGTTVSTLIRDALTTAASVDRK
jgi:uncharacterized protein (DUF1778 family)